MGEVSTIGLDIAKSVFPVHGVDGTGAVVMRKRVGRSKVLEFFGGLAPCLVGIEAWPSAHYWSRELQALGHTAVLLSRAIAIYDGCWSPGPWRSFAMRDSTALSELG